MQAGYDLLNGDCRHTGASIGTYAAGSKIYADIEVTDGTLQARMTNAAEIALKTWLTK